MKPKMRIMWTATWLVWVGCFAFIGWKNLDPDFGWHVQMGNYTARFGLPATDPFSYTMPSFPFIDHEWLTNRLMAEILNRWGYLAEALIFGSLAGVLLWLIVPRGKLVWAIVPVLMGAGVWLARGGVRPQVLDWIFLAGLLRLSWQAEVWAKWRWTIIPLFGLWANLHGGFAIGPAVLGVIIAFKSWENRLLAWQDVLVWTGGVLATWLNPYGPRLWHEVWMQMTDSHLRWSVAEWQPFWVRAELGVWLLATLVWATLTQAKFRIEKWKLAVTAGLLLAGLSSLRHMSLLMIMLVLLATEQVEIFAAKIKPNRLAWTRAKKFYLLVIAIAAVIFVEEVGVMVWRTARGTGAIVYPTQAIKFLRQKNYPGQVFSEYGWGGYLIWQYPEKKVFMDGRMPSWRWTAPEGESNWAFKDYIKVRDEGVYQDYFTRYDIRVVLWPKYNLIGEVPKNNLGWWARLMRTGLGKESINFKQKLEEAGWKQEYADDTAIVYVKPE